MNFYFFIFTGVDINFIKILYPHVGGGGGGIIAAVWIGGWNAAQFICSLIKGIEINPTHIILSGLAIAACFTPVYFNLIMDKVKEIKLGA